jgi:hypothetical protein
LNNFELQQKSEFTEYIDYLLRFEIGIIRDAQWGLVVEIWGFWDSTNSYFSYLFKTHENSRILMKKEEKFAKL